MEKLLTVKDIEKKLNTNRAKVLRIAAKNNWKVIKRLEDGVYKNFYYKQDIDKYLGVPIVKEETEIVEKMRTVPTNEIEDLDELPDWNKQITLSRYFICVQLEMAYENQCGSKESIIRKFIGFIKGIYPEQTKAANLQSVSTLRRWYSRYLKDPNNPLVLTPDYGKNRGLRKLKPEIAMRAKQLYLSKNKPTMMNVYERIILEFGKEAATYNVIRQFLKYDINSLEKDYGRMGEKEFKDAHAPYIVRSYTNLRPNELWVSDGHDCEFMIYHPYKKDSKGNRLISSPKIIVWMDVKSRLVTGWTLSWGETVESIALALKNGIKQWGRPEGIYTDNGRAYKGRILKGDGDKLSGLYTTLGITKDKQKHAIAYNAQAKHIERSFLDFKKSFATTFMTYKGGNIIERPEKLKNILKDNKDNNIFLEQKELEEYLNWYIDYKNHDYYKIRSKKHRGDGMNGMTPLEMMKTLKMSERFMLSEERLKLLFLYEEIRTVQQNGITYLDNTYEHKKLYLHLKEKMKIKFDPMDLGFIYVYKITGEFLCKAQKMNVYGFNDTQQFKEHGARLKKFRSAINKAMDIKQEIIDNDQRSIDYIEEVVQENKIKAEKMKKLENKKEKIIKVAGFEVPIEED